MMLDADIVKKLREKEEEATRIHLEATAELAQYVMGRNPNLAEILAIWNTTVKKVFT